MNRLFPALVVTAALVCGFLLWKFADPHNAEIAEQHPSAERYPTSDSSLDPKIKHGQEVVRTRPLSTLFAKVEDFKKFWTVWEDGPEKENVKKMQGNALIAAVARHYGQFTADYDNNGLPLGWIQVMVPDGKGGKDAWMMQNCYSCHSSQINGKMVWGAWNPRFDFQQMVNDNLRYVAKGVGIPVETLVKKMPYTLNQVAGHMNVIQSLGIDAALRAPDMSLRAPVDIDKVLSVAPSSINALPWWNSGRKKRFYWDGWMSSKAELHSSDFAEMIVQFGGDDTGMPLVNLYNTPEQINAMLPDLADVYAYHMSTATLKFPAGIDENLPAHFTINKDLAADGEKIFNTKVLTNGSTCLNCHGSYGSSPNYQTLFFPAEEVGTDGQRYSNLKMLPIFLDWYRSTPSLLLKPDASGKPVHVDVEQQRGYLAPPLNGIWASAPYLHNGSVPTLRDLLRPSERPAVWKIVESDTDMYDGKKVGLKVEAVKSIPNGILEVERRKYFDSTSKLPGFSNAGHEFAAALTEPEVDALLEYLKTL